MQPNRPTRFEDGRQVHDRKVWVPPTDALFGSHSLALLEFPRDGTQIRPVSSAGTWNVFIWVRNPGNTKLTCPHCSNLYQSDMVLAGQRDRSQSQHFVWKPYLDDAHYRVIRRAQQKNGVLNPTDVIQQRHYLLYDLYKFLFLCIPMLFPLSRRLSLH